MATKWKLISAVDNFETALERLKQLVEIYIEEKEQCPTTSPNGETNGSHTIKVQEK